MNAVEIIQEIHQYNGTITANGDHLNLRAPKPLPDDLVTRIKACKPDLLVALSIAFEDQANIQESIEERAAIQEHEGGLLRHEAEQAAKSTMRVYRYRLTDNPDTWLTMIAPGCDLKEAEQSLINRFGEVRVLDICKNTT